ncbi:MAG TPA: alpha/beta fold hydrolase, partial [Polyangia bacterium]
MSVSITSASTYLRFFHVALPHHPSSAPSPASSRFARWSGLAWRSSRARSGDGDKSPFYARGTGQRAVLCLHGFTGTPFEVRPLAEALAAQGFTTLAPVLAGHGGTVDDLAETTHVEWLASAETALQALSREVGGAPIMVAGFSLGGLLALRLARLHPTSVAALAVMAAPLRLSPLQAMGVRAIARLPRL